MAKLQPSIPFDHFSGKFSFKESIVMRTRNGRTHAYAIKKPYDGPLAESRKRAISTFVEAVRRCKIEMSDPNRLAYWQERYLQYRKAARKSLVQANNQFLTTTSLDEQSNNSDQTQKPNKKFYSTLRGFIIASISAQLNDIE